MNVRRSKQRVALVTGASSGIGMAVARKLLAHGVAVAAVARRQSLLDELAFASGSGRLLVLPGDVGDERFVDDAIQATLSQLGHLDMVVNNAGVALLSPILDADTEGWRRMIATNILGIMYVTHKALPHLLVAAGGDDGVADIVFISSVVGRFADQGQGVYSATKFAVNGFAESLRQEVSRKGVRVCVVEPGSVATELTDHIQHAASRVAAKDAARQLRQLTAEDVADSVFYAVSVAPHVSVNELLIRPTDQNTLT